MGWKFTPRNIISVAAAPFTAGTSLAFAKDNEGNTLLDHFTGAASAKKANEQNIALQKEINQQQIDLQNKTNQQSINLANTAHQREVADLEAAGLNPILSTGGMGAATPSLGTASINAPQVQNTLPGGLMGQAAQAAGILGTIASAKQAATAAELQEQQTGAIPSQIQLNQATAAKELTEAGYKDKEIDYYMQHGVFPGATTTKTTGTPWGNSSETIPVGIKEPQNANSATKAINQRKGRDKLTQKTEEEIEKLHKKYGKWWY